MFENVYIWCMEQLKAFIARQPEGNGNTRGAFTFGEFHCFTLELLYLLNQHGISCIPTGSYVCEKVAATAHIPYPHISVTNVPNRTGICIHIANYAGVNKSDVLGCIAVGSAYGDLNGDGVSEILNSHDTFKALMTAVPDKFILIISQ